MTLESIDPQIIDADAITATLLKRPAHLRGKCPYALAIEADLQAHILPIRRLQVLLASAAHVPIVIVLDFLVFATASKAALLVEGRLRVLDAVVA